MLLGYLLLLLLTIATLIIAVFMPLHSQLLDRVLHPELLPLEFVTLLLDIQVPAIGPCQQQSLENRPQACEALHSILRPAIII